MHVGYVDEDADEGHIVIATVNAFDLGEVSGGISTMYRCEEKI